MRFRIRCRMGSAFAAISILALLSACTGTPTPAPIVESPATEPAGRPASEVIVYASDLSSDALSELYFLEDPASPGGAMITLSNNGDELDPPPENDPHVIFTVPVQSGIPYRCWVHMKVGEPKGRSTANVVWVQFSDSVDQANQKAFRPGTDSYLTAQGPTQTGWTWVGCDAEDPDSFVYFQTGGDVTVRIQAGAEGVGFDQFLLSPARFLDSGPTDPIVAK